MRYFYARVSTKDQSLERQLEAAKEYKGEFDAVFADKATGKNFNRPEYIRLKGIVRRGDEVVIKELDRLGRNKLGIKDELRWFRDRGVIVRVLNVPTTLLEMPEGQEWVFDMVNNILIEVMGAIAQNELETTRRRCREGFDAMPRDAEGYRISAKTGRRCGKIAEPTPQFEEYYFRVKSGEITNETAYKQLCIGKTKWYRLCKEFSSARA